MRPVSWFLLGVSCFCCGIAWLDHAEAAAIMALICYATCSILLAVEKRP